MFLFRVDMKGYGNKIRPESPILKAYAASATHL